MSSMTDENGLGAISEEVASLEVLIERATALQPLTAIEKHICSLMFTGHTAKEIAVLRSCSYRTVERHIANLKLKIGELKLSPAALLAIHNLDLKKSNESDAIAQQDL